MSIYGKVEVQYYQLTATGASRVQQGTWPSRVHPETKRIIRDLAELGGTAEWDELKMKTGINPNVLSTALRRAVDLGYVTPVTFGAEEQGRR